MDRSLDYSPRYDTYTSDEYPPDWDARRRRVLQRDGYICQGCGLRSTRVDEIRFDVDHIVPKSEGGSHATENLQTLCRTCHAEKHPSNRELQRRGREFTQRNQPSILVQILQIIIRLVRGSAVTEQNILTDDDGRQLKPRSVADAATLEQGVGVTVEVTLVDLWQNNSPSVHQMGKLTDMTRSEHTDNSGEDESQEVRFVVWSGNNHQRLRQDHDYRIIGAKTNVYDGAFQLVIDNQTAIQPL